MAKDNGGSAFPHSGERLGSDGMSLRDYFAAHLFAECWRRHTSEEHEQAAADAYRCADELLAARAGKI